MIDTATVLVAYLLGRELFDRRVGLVAATFLAFTPLHIQYSHFHGAEPWVTFFVALGLLLSIRLASRLAAHGGAPTEKAGRVLAIAATTGVVFGLASASKLIGVATLVVPATALAIAAAPAIGTLVGAMPRANRWTALAVGAIGLVVTGLASVAASSLLVAMVFACLTLIGVGASFVIGIAAGERANPAPRRMLYDQDAPNPQRMVTEDRAGRASGRLALTAAAGVLVLVATAVTFRIFQPYAFDGLATLDVRFTDDLTYLEGVNAGGGFPWVVQWIGRTPLWFPLETAFWWGMGPALGLAVLVGLVRGGADVVRRHRWITLVPLVLIAMLLALVSQQFNPLIRYVLPAYPAAIVLGGYGIVSTFDAGRRAIAASRVSVGRVLQGVAFAGVAASVFWGLAFVNGVYNTDHPRIQASEWMAENLPAGSVLSVQAWDDALPLPVAGAQGTSFSHVQLDPFLPDRAITGEGLSKTEQLIAGLDQVDYVVEASNRLYDSIPRFPAKYPATTAYYEALFDGSLGFEQIVEFENSPSLFGIDIDSSEAEETFTVYDHPTVTIWQKTDRWSPERATAILNPDQATRAPDLEPKDAATNALQLRPDERAALLTGETFSESFSDDGPTGTLTWLWWLVWLQLAAFAVLPWTTVLFGRLPDRGYGLSKVIGFATVGMITWSAVSWGLVDYSRGAARAGLAITVLVGAVVWFASRSRMASLFRQHQRAWLATEIVFFAVFGFVLWLRSQNPDLWEQFLGGEKPMELAYLTAIGRTSELPAYDPWFAGGFMNYYYMGWYLLTVPMRAMRVLPEVAFQLGVATYAALAAATTFSTVHNLVAISRRRWGSRDNLTSKVPVRAGYVGVLLFLGIGNLDALRQHQRRLAGVNTWETAADWPVIGEVVVFLGGTWAWIRGASLPRFDWWGPSRVNTNVDGQVVDITEFPYFTFLFGDLHPHMMGLTFVGLTIGVALAYVCSMRAGDRFVGATLAIGLGIATGLVRTVNTWDHPTGIVLAVAAVGIGWFLLPPLDEAGTDTTAPAPTSDRRGWAALLATVGLAAGLSIGGGPGGAIFLLFGLAGAIGAAALLAGPELRRRLLGGVGHLAVVGAVHMGVFWPFLRNSETFDTGVGRAEFFTPRTDYFAHWGVFIVLAAAFLLALVVDGRRRRRIAGRPTNVVLPAVVFVGAVLAGLAGGSQVSWVFGFALVGALLALALLVVELRRDDPDIGRIITLGMVSLGMAIAGGPDLFTVENDISRMNTVFKFWLQAWQLLALAGGVSVWFVARVLSERVPTSVAQTNPDLAARPQLLTVAPRRRHQAWLGLVGLMLLAGAAYPLLATKPRLETRFNDLGATLDGLAYLDEDPVIFKRDQGNDGPEVTVALQQDLLMIEWMRDNVEGRPTIVEWSGNLYDWNGRFAIHTGLPTVLGWDWHQKQQRWDFTWMVDERRNDIQRLYTDADPDFVATFLRTYEVGYVLIGTQEHRHGNEFALATINTHPALREVFRDGDKAIYEVLPGQLYPGIDLADLDLQAASE